MATHGMFVKNVLLSKHITFEQKCFIKSPKTVTLKGLFILLHVYFYEENGTQFRIKMCLYLTKMKFCNYERILIALLVKETD